VEVTVSGGNCEIDQDTNGGQKKECDAAKEYCKRQKEPPTFPPAMRWQMVRRGEMRVVVIVPTHA